jgi:hypothetical protein
MNVYSQTYKQRPANMRCVSNLSSLILPNAAETSKHGAQH